MNKEKKILAISEDDFDDIVLKKHCFPTNTLSGQKGKPPKQTSFNRRQS